MNTSTGSHVCTICHSIITPKKINQGSALVELFVWIISLILITFTAGISILLAVAFSIWRVVSKKNICPECKAVDIVPIGTPVAKRIIAENQDD